MTVQDITMGYDRGTGQRIMLSEHEQTFIEFCEYRGIDPHEWKKSDQIGYYRALQEDWETARDDEMTPMVVDHYMDLPEIVRERQDHIEREARGIRGRFGTDVWERWQQLPADKRVKFIRDFGVAPEYAGLVAQRVSERLKVEFSRYA